MQSDRWEQIYKLQASDKRQEKLGICFTSMTKSKQDGGRWWAWPAQGSGLICEGEETAPQRPQDSFIKSSPCQGEKAPDSDREEEMADLSSDDSLLVIMIFTGPGIV